MEEAPQKSTLGEELFMIHLSRMSDVPEEIDREISQIHKPQTTVGESLWQVHLKRSAGSQEELDEEDTVGRKRSSRKKSKLERFNRKVESLRRAPSRILKLRNRKVTIS
jgi:hypothetical protein